jgi:uncharacterized RDD family membrane protein YckC
MNKKDKLAFEKSNYIFMLIGIGVLILGFFIMTLDKEDYGFGFLGITLGPVLVMIGFIMEFFAIFHKSKK